MDQIKVFENGDFNPLPEEVKNATLQEATRELQMPPPRTPEARNARYEASKIDGNRGSVSQGMGSI